MIVSHHLLILNAWKISHVVDLWMCLIYYRHSQNTHRWRNRLVAANPFNRILWSRLKKKLDQHTYLWSNTDRRNKVDIRNHTNHTLIIAIYTLSLKCIHQKYTKYYSYSQGERQKWGLGIFIIFTDEERSRVFTFFLCGGNLGCLYIFFTKMKVATEIIIMSVVCGYHCKCWLLQNTTCKTFSPKMLG